MKISSFRLVAAIGIMLSMTGCSLMQSQPKTPEEQVQARSEKRLEYLLAGDIEKAYEFMTPGYRTNHGVQRFRADFAAGVARWRSAEFLSAECEEDVCIARVKIAYDHQSSITAKPFTIDRVTQERWIRVDDQWWFVRLN